MSSKNLLSDYSSTGHRLSNVAHLDAHYVSSQKSYEAMLNAVGLEPGWHVLDAGCGSGSFLPLMADLLGSNGKIDAYDLAPENIEHVRVLTTGWFRALALPRWLRLAGLVDITQGSFWEEKRIPLSEHDRNFIAGGLKFWGKEFESLELSDSDLRYGRVLQDPDSPEHPLNSPDFYFRSSYSLAVGQKPL